MSAKSSELQAIFDRIEAGKRLRQADVRSLVSAVQSQQVTIATGDRAVAIGGSAEGAVIVTGDRNIVITGTDTNAIQELMGKRPRNERLLLKTIRNEVTTRLRQSLHDAILIQLGIEVQPEQVKRPWDLDIKIGNKPSEPLPKNLGLLDVFNSEDISGQLLILGRPGSGKTTMMIDLAKVLVVRAEQESDYPIPILLNLSTWKDDGQSIRDWLVMELKIKYGIRADIGKYWIDNQTLLPMLDGLDELKPIRQELCTKAINQFLSSESRPLSIVICSRIEEYYNYRTRLRLNGAINLHSLNSLQLHTYLSSVNRLDLWQAVKDSYSLKSLLKIPLFLSIAILAGQELSVQEWQGMNSRATRIEYLLDAYTRRMLKREINSTCYQENRYPSTKNTRNWMGLLALYLNNESQVEFLIESLQPHLLKHKTQIWAYTCLNILILMGCLSSTSALILRISLNNISFSNALAASGIFFLVVLPFTNKIYEKIEPVETIKFSLRNIDEPIFILSFFVGFVMSAISAGISASAHNYWILFPALIGGFLLGEILVFLVFGWKVAGDVKTKILPNEGIRLSIINGIFSLFVLSLMTVIGLKLFLFISPSFNGSWMNFPFYIFVCCILSWAQNFGVKTFVKHFSLRLILYFTKWMPWNYSRFLDYCTERLFLQRIGGRYRFIHRLLQEHFAAMPLEQVRGDR